MLPPRAGGPAHLRNALMALGYYEAGHDGDESRLRPDALHWTELYAAARRLYGTIHEGDWFHVGTPHQLAEAERVLG